MKDAYTNASSSLRESALSYMCAGKEQMALLEIVMPRMCYRAHKSYATILAFANNLASLITPIQI